MEWKGLARKWQGEAENGIVELPLIMVRLEHWIASLQIIFSYKPVICQARDKVWPDMQPVWLDKKRRENDMYTSDAFLDTFLDRQWHFKKCLLNYLMKTVQLLYECWQEQYVYV